MQTITNLLNQRVIDQMQFDFLMAELSGEPLTFKIPSYIELSRYGQTLINKLIYYLSTELAWGSEDYSEFEISLMGQIIIQLLDHQAIPHNTILAQNLTKTQQWAAVQVNLN